MQFILCYFCRMRYFYKFLNVIIDSSLWVAFSALSLTAITYINFQLSVNQNVLFFVFFATVLGYNFVKYYKLVLGSALRFELSSFKLVIFISLLSLPLCIYFFFSLNTETQLLMVIPGLLTLFYTVSYKNNTLRNLKGAKIYVITICWVFVTVGFPVVDANIPIGKDVLIESFQRLLFVLVIILPFEIRDMLEDSKSLGTIPQKIGEKKTKILGGVLMLVFFLIEFGKNNRNTQKVIVLLIVLLMVLVFLHYSSKNFT